MTLNVSHDVNLNFYPIVPSTDLNFFLTIARRQDLHLCKFILDHVVSLAQGRLKHLVVSSHNISSIVAMKLSKVFSRTKWEGAISVNYW